MTPLISFTGLLFFLFWGCVNPGVVNAGAALETITYDIKQFNLTVGEAALVSHGLVADGSRKVYLVVFSSRAMNFFDEEKIYLEPETFLPIRVERDLNIFGKKERIVEHYNAGEGTVRIVKTVRGKTTEQTLQRGRQVENIYGFICRYRKTGKFSIGENMRIYLPTRDVAFTLIGKNALEIAGRHYSAYFLQSDPAKYKVWFDQSPERIPLRIDGTVGLGKTAMVLREYRL